jgi:hypothetical protein
MLPGARKAQRMQTGTSIHNGRRAPIPFSNHVSYIVQDGLMSLQRHAGCLLLHIHIFQATELSFFFRYCQCVREY